MSHDRAVAAAAAAHHRTTAETPPASRHALTGPAPARRRPAGRFRIAGADLSASIAVFLHRRPAVPRHRPRHRRPAPGRSGRRGRRRHRRRLLGGAPLQVSGPAAGLTVVTADLIQRYGWRTTCAITVLRRPRPTRPGLPARGPRGARCQPRDRARHARRHRRHHRPRPAAHRARRQPRRARRSPTPSRCPTSWRDLHPAALLDQRADPRRAAGLAAAARAGGPGGAHGRRPPLAAVAAATAVAALAGLRLPRVDLPSWRSHALPELPRGPGARRSSPPC